MPSLKKFLIVGGIALAAVAIAMRVGALRRIVFGAAAPAAPEVTFF